MLLVKTDPGQYVDRQTILELKIDYADIEFKGDVEPDNTSGILSGNYRYARQIVHNPNKINVGPFFDELELIRAKLLKFWIPDISNSETRIMEYDRLYDALKDTNGELWDLENKARVLRAAPDRLQTEAAKQAAEVLFAINDLNDKRSELVKKINALWNIGGQEKFYE